MTISFFFKSKQDPGISINHVMMPIVNKIGEMSNYDIKICYLPSSGLNIKSIITNLRFVYKHRTKDGINHVIGEVHYALYALIGCKSIITVHDIGFWTVDKYNIFKRIVLYCTHLFPIKLADRVVAISNFTQYELTKEIPSIKDRVTVIPSGSVDGFDYSPKDLDESNVVVLQNGVRPHKNLETTIRALEGLPYKLLVVRKMYDSQIQLAKQLNVSFENLYDLSTEEIKETYRTADIVCAPSSYEGFGVIPIEAQSIGRPVITTNKEPMISVSGDAALYINDPKNPKELRKAILQLVHNKVLRDKLIRNGLTNSKKFLLDTIANQYIKVLSEIDRNDKSRNISNL